MNRLASGDSALPRPPARPLAGAYELGRHLNRLSYIATQAWLLDRWRIVEEAPELQTLIVTARRAVDELNVQDRVRESVRAFVDDLRPTFDSDWHADDLVEAELELRRTAAGGSEFPLCQVIREIADRISRTPLGLVNELRTRLDVVLDESQRHLVRLAEHIDQGAYPQTILRELLEDAVAQFDTRGTQGETVLSWATMPDRIVQSEQASLWPTDLCHASQRVPSEAWLAEADYLWDQCDLPREDFAEQMRLLRLAEPGTNEVVNIVTRIHQTALVALASPVSVLRPRAQESVVHRADAAASSTFLGLSFDESTHRITRVGRRDSVEFGSRLTPFRLARTLAEMGERRTELEWLRQHWSRIGNAENPEPATIYDAISNLRLELGILGITINNRSNLGWRLIEAEQEAIV
jgi:hypothetical protein